LNPRLLGAWISVTIFGAVLGTCGVIVYLAFVLFPQSLAVQILLMLLVFVFALGLFFVSIFLIISSVRLLIVIDMPKDAAELGFYFFKLKLTRCIIVFIIIVYPSMFIIIIDGIGLLWGDFLTVYFSVAITSPGTTIMAIMFSTLTFFTLIHTQKLRSLYCSSDNKHYNVPVTQPAK
jgi:hypothetical protein